MEYLRFPARLSAVYNSIMETGEGDLSAGGDSVDFHADFIPLLPLGSEARIEWVCAERGIAVYEGQVYLSTPNMLRLVGVDAALVARARGILAANTRLPGQLREAPDDPETPPRAAEILYLSPGMVKLLLPGPFAAGGQLLLDVEVNYLTLRGLCLRVRQALPLHARGQGPFLLLCEVAPSGNDNYVALSSYSKRLGRLGK